MDQELVDFQTTISTYNVYFMREYLFYSVTKSTSLGTVPSIIFDYYWRDLSK